MISAEAIQLIQDTAQKAKKARVIYTDADGRHCLVQFGDTLNPHPLPPPVRNYDVGSLADLIAFVEDTVIVARPAIFHDQDGVILLCNEADRRDTVTFELTFSQQFGRLMKLQEQPGGFDQRAFVRYLQVEMGVDRAMVNPWRRLDFKTVTAAMGEVSPGKDRMGRDIQSQVQGVADLPEEILFVVPVYRQCGERTAYAVRCAIELDAANQRISLTPFAGEIEAAIDASQMDIHARLVRELPEVPVYYGSP